MELITRENYNPTLSVRECEDFIREGGYWYYLDFSKNGVNVIVRNENGFLLNNKFEDIELGMNIGVEAVRKTKEGKFNRNTFLEELFNN